MATQYEYELEEEMSPLHEYEEEADPFSGGGEQPQAVIDGERYHFSFALFGPVGGKQEQRHAVGAAGNGNGKGRGALEVAAIYS